MRQDFCNLGGKILFKTMFEGFCTKKGKVFAVVSDQGEIETDYLIVASGQAAFETYRMMIKNGVNFRTKNFAIGYRIEHKQAIINQAQWGCEELPGLKAAEYRLTFKGDSGFPVYSFCMCPGGVIVPSGAYENTSVVNGMSMYARSGKFANGGIVAGVHPDHLLGATATPLEALSCLEMHEQNFFEFSDGYEVPYCSIRDFIKQRMPMDDMPETSYPLGLKPAALWNLLPREISRSIRKGLQNFSKKINNFKDGTIMGLESKTSSPIQVIRKKNALCEGFDNLFMVGEGSGFAGGIVSSAADGIKAAMAIVED